MRSIFERAQAVRVGWQGFYCSASRLRLRGFGLPTECPEQFGRAFDSRREWRRRSNQRNSYRLMVVLDFRYWRLFTRNLALRFGAFFNRDREQSPGPDHLKPFFPKTIPAHRQFRIARIYDGGLSLIQGAF